jgi:hypothetical protein
LDAGIFSFIDIDDAGVVTATGANYLCGHGAGDELFFEGQQGLQAPRLGCIFGEAHLLQPHVFDLLLELAILGAHAAQIEVVVPQAASAVPHPDQAALEGSDGAYRPNADQARLFLIHAVLLDLHRQPEHLQKQHSHKNDQVSITANDGFHKKPVSKVQGFKVSMRQGPPSEGLSAYSQP